MNRMILYVVNVNAPSKIHLQYVYTSLVHDQTEQTSRIVGRWGLDQRFLDVITAVFIQRLNTASVCAFVYADLIDTAGDVDLNMF